MSIFSKVTLYNYVFRIAYLVITFIAVPISLNYLGNERYGIWQTIMNIIGFVSLTNFGIGNGLRNRVTEYYTKDDKISLKKVISSAYISLTFIALLLLIILVPVFYNLNYNLIYSNLNIQHNEIAFAFIITISGFSINFVLGLVTSIIYGIHKSHLVTLSQLISSIISLILTSLLIGKTSNLCFIAVIYSISNIVVNIFLTLMVFRLDKNYIPSIKFFDKVESKHLYTLGMSFFILQIVYLLMNTSDNFIVAKLIGVEDVTDYSIVNKVFNIIPTLFSIILIQLWSQTAKEATLNNYTGIKKIMKKLIKLLIPIGFILILLVLSFDLVTMIWLGYKLDINKLMLICAALHVFLTCFNGIFVNIQNGLGIIKYQTISYSIAALLQIPIAYILVNYCGIGISGVMLCKVIIMLIPSITNCMHIYFLINKKCKTEVLTYDSSY